MQATFRDYLKLHFVVILLGFTAILGRLIEASFLAVVVYRTFITALCLALLVWLAKGRLQLPRRSVVALMATGVLIGVHWLCFFGSARLATVSISLVCVSTTSFFTSLVEPILFKRSISKLEVILGVLVVVGIGILFSVEFRHIEGILLGLLGAFLGSIFSVLNARWATRFEARLVNFYEMAGAFLVSLLITSLLLVMQKVTIADLVLSATDWGWLLILSLVCTVYAYTAMVELLKKMSAFTLNLSINMEPIYGILMAVMIFGERERMTSGFYLGASLILATVVLHPILTSAKWKKRIS